MSNTETKSITVQALINATVDKVWNNWIMPEHITKWNFASPDWHCPKAENNFVVGGEFHYTMSAKDGSFSFDFWGTYNKIENEKLIDITLGDGRKMLVEFKNSDDKTIVTETFEVENINPVEIQKMGWQAILDNFKKHTEA